jgi:hypothetical protein
MYSTAIDVAGRSRDVAEGRLRPRHLSVAASEELLGRVYVGRRRTADARPLLEHALKVRLATLGPQHPAVKRRRETLSRLAQ